jgi:histidinol-phosphatase (PHP family)
VITIDYHTHHARCGHATGTIENYIQAAIGKNLTEIGISDHCPIYFMEGNDPMPSTAMAKDELDGYVEEVLRLKRQYAGKIDVKLGLEVDYIEGMEDACRGILAAYPFDYTIGSVHFIFGKNVYDAKRWQHEPDVLATYAEYYRLIAKSASSGLFSFLAHTSAIIAYAPKPIPDAIQPLQDAALEAIRVVDMCIEINTSGYRKMHTDPFPTNRMIAKAVALGIPLTFGSDSHHPEQVAFNRDHVFATLQNLGVTHLSNFTAGQRSSVSLTTVQWA